MVFNNKKGSTTDLLIALVILFVAGIVMLIASSFWGSIRDSDLGTLLPDGKYVIDDFDKFGVWTFDFILIMAFIGFFVGSVILAAFAKHHPLVAWINVLIMVILVMISVPISNGYTDVVNSNALVGESGTIGIFNFMMANLPFLTIIFGAFLLLAMFAFKSEVTAI